jgi:hypothetical protein
LGAAAAAAAPFLLAAAKTAPKSRTALPDPGATLTAANERARRIAQSSPFVRAQMQRAVDLVDAIANAELRAGVHALLERPVPSYARRYGTPAQRVALRDTLVREGLLQAGTSPEAIFPRGTTGNTVVQPFWSAPGSDLRSHHSYPGGLLVHESFNAQISQHFAQTYNAQYFAGKPVVDSDTVIAAAFYHDIMKTVVFQFNDDGTLLEEAQIAGTGAHHCLSGAEAIARGHDARFVTVLLSAHAAPSLGDEARVADWCRASAIIAGVDPVEFGLVRRTAAGYALASLPPIEAFVSHLSDHDFVLTIPAVREVVPRLCAMNPSPWFRHETLARTSAVALYEALLRGGEREFERAVRA